MYWDMTKSYVAELRNSRAGEIVVDNDQPIAPGKINSSWTGTGSLAYNGAKNLMGEAAKFGNNERIAQPGDGSDHGEYRPDIAVNGAGDYEVYAWWTSDPDRASNVPYTCYYDGANTGPMLQNQKVNGGKWVYLGTYPFEGDGLGACYVSNAGVNGTVSMDAMKFVPVSDGTVVVDNDDAGWSGSSNPAPSYNDTTLELQRMYGGDERYAPTGNGDGSYWSEYRPDIPATGFYSVYAYWTSGPDRAKDVPYTCYFGPNAASHEVVRVDQSAAATGGTWVRLGTWQLDELDNGACYISNDVDPLVSASSTYVMMDAIKWVPEL